MKWVLALVMLISLVCIVGLVASQSEPSFLGEGYSYTQLQFFNGQNTADFQPIVEQYWNSYIQNQNPAISNQSNVMSIWLNNFPLDFDKQVQISSSSFTANAPVATNVSSNALQSDLLKRDVNLNFNQDQGWKYTSAATTTVSAGSGNGVPTNDAQGLIISQGIISFF